jgi:predicted peptidase
LRIALAVLAFGAFHAKAEMGFLNRTVTVDKTAFRYVVYVPSQWAAGKNWPVILFLLPQCREDSDWSANAMQAQVLAALDAATKEFHGDPDRTYPTGFSMGGYGTWNLASSILNGSPLS